LEALTTPIGVLAVLVVVVSVNAFLFFGYYLPRTTTPSTAPASPQIERIPPSTTTVERTRPTTNIVEEETTTSETTTSIY
jgi:hypothetical protein